MYDIKIIGGDDPHRNPIHAKLKQPRCGRSLSHTHNSTRTSSDFNTACTNFSNPIALTHHASSQMEFNYTQTSNGTACGERRNSRLLERDLQQVSLTNRALLDRLLQKDSQLVQATMAYIQSLQQSNRELRAANNAQHRALLPVTNQVPTNLRRPSSSDEKEHQPSFQQQFNTKQVLIEIKNKLERLLDLDFTPPKKCIVRRLRPRPAA